MIMVSEERRIKVEASKIGRTVFHNGSQYTYIYIRLYVYTYVYRNKKREICRINL